AGPTVQGPGPQGDPLAAPDVTMDMAAAFVRVCDLFQLRLFVPVILFGLRAAEPCGLFAEHLSEDWLGVPATPTWGWRPRAGVTSGARSHPPSGRSGTCSAVAGSTAFSTSGGRWPPGGSRPRCGGP